LRQRENERHCVYFHRKGAVNESEIQISVIRGGNEFCYRDSFDKLWWNLCFIFEKESLLMEIIL
jgi:hypothetical protein